MWSRRINKKKTHTQQIYVNEWNITTVCLFISLYALRILYEKKLMFSSSRLFCNIIFVKPLIIFVVVVAWFFFGLLCVAHFFLSTLCIEHIRNNVRSCSECKHIHCQAASKTQTLSHNHIKITMIFVYQFYIFFLLSLLLVHTLQTHAAGREQARSTHTEREEEGDNDDN